MSLELLHHYLPEGRYKWVRGGLTYSPWSCNLSAQKPFYTFPMSVRCQVDLIDGEWQWTVRVTDWEYNQTWIKGTAEDAVEALRLAEDVADKEWDKLMPDWVKVALEHKWGPPCPPALAIKPPVTVVQYSGKGG